MNHTLFSWIIVIFFSVRIASCQTELGIHLRIGETNLYDQHRTGTLDKISSSCVGIHVTKKIGRNSVFSFEINSENKGAHYNIRNINFSLNYVTVPIYFGFDLLGDRIRILPGMYFGIVSGSSKFLANSSPRMYYRFNSFDYGISYKLELFPINVHMFKLTFSNSMSYGLISAYDLVFGPRITKGSTDWIRNFNYNIGINISYKFTKGKVH